MSVVTESIVQHRPAHKLTARVRAIDDVTSRECAAMYALMAEHYAHVTPERFSADLAEKQWVLQVLDADGNIRGFSTQKVFSVTIDNRRAYALFSGDTIVHRDDWGQTALTQQWGRFALELMVRYADAPLDWFLISKGYKTYRFLPVFFREFYPRYDRPTPAAAQAMLNALARMKFGAAFDALRGVIAADRDGCRLRPGVADVTPGRLQDPHVRFFQERNPRHAHGDELCCLAPLTPENFTTAAYRVIGEGT
jgi:hypothetical protein